jgi:predicted esterase
MRKFLFFFLIAVSIQTSNAQEVFRFSEGLASGPVHQYARDAIYTDALAWQLYTQGLAPKEGSPVIADPGKTNVWANIKADSNGVFRGQSLGSGYLYLRYNSPKKQNAVIIAAGHSMLYFNGLPHSGDRTRLGWMQVPVELKKGLNETYMRTAGMGRFGAMTARLEFPTKPLSILSADSTLPYFVNYESKGSLWGAVVVRNTSTSTYNTLIIEARVEGTKIVSALPSLLALTTRKVPFQIPVPNNIKKGKYTLELKLYNGKKLVDNTTFDISAVNPEEHASYTFISDIDGSVQYYGVAPQKNPNGAAPSLFFSVHGNGVEAIGQARAYKQKEDGPIVAPTNRRPGGFNWEDWGRLDALEVLKIAKDKYKPDPQKIYLTGHSMGGHGTWFLGATYAGSWAAIAPCAGYPTLSAYGSNDGRIPTEAATPVAKMLLRSSNPSNVLALAKNYKAGGVYIFHGDADETVPVTFARQMRKLLGEFHQDFSYYEYPGGSHWFGDQSVDWKPLFDFFRWHSIPVSEKVNEIDFTTASTGISATHRWITILQQQRSFEYSNITLSRDLKKKTIQGKTKNIATLSIDLSDFKTGDTVTLELDQQTEKFIRTADAVVVLAKNSRWEKTAAPSLNEKGVTRNGGFKEPFNNRMIFVYGTKGTPEENTWASGKAKYDAETWYYRANGAVDIISDAEFLKGNYEERGVVLYGNITTNAAAAALLRDCPVKIERGKATVGEKIWTGDDLASYYMWPKLSGNKASVALIGGTGIKGMKAADANQYFSGGSGFPDFMVFTLDMLKDGDKAVKAAGYYNNQWKLGDDWAWQD